MAGRPKRRARRSASNSSASKTLAKLGIRRDRDGAFVGGPIRGDQLRRVERAMVKVERARPSPKPRDQVMATYSKKRSSISLRQFLEYEGVRDGDIARHFRDLKRNGGDRTVTEFNVFQYVYYIVTEPRGGDQVTELIYTPRKGDPLSHGDS